MDKQDRLVQVSGTARGCKILIGKNVKLLKLLKLYSLDSSLGSASAWGLKWVLSGIQIMLERFELFQVTKVNKHNELWFLVHK